MTTWIVIFFLAGLAVWLFYKWIQSKTLRKIEREGNERAADDVRAAILIKENLSEIDKDDAADELDVMRKRMHKSKHNRTDS